MAPEEPPAAPKSRTFRFHRAGNSSAELGSLERGGDEGDDGVLESDAAQFVLVTRPRVRVVQRVGGGRRPHKVVSEFRGWETVSLPVGARRAAASGFERERLASATA